MESSQNNSADDCFTGSKKQNAKSGHHFINESGVYGICLIGFDISLIYHDCSGLGSVPGVLRK